WRLGAAHIVSGRVARAREGGVAHACANGQQAGRSHAGVASRHAVETYDSIDFEAHVAEYGFEIASSRCQSLDDAGRIRTQLHADALPAQGDPRMQRADGTQVECGFDRPGAIGVAFVLSRVVLFDSQTHDTRTIVMAYRQLDEN